MEKLYYEDPYLRSFDARVVSCREETDRFEIILDRTAFYPEGGGQPSDTGVLGGVRVLAVHERDGRVVHDADGPLAEGIRVTGELDWEPRFTNMQQHSGEHIVSGLIHRKYGYDNVGFHMGSEEMTIDLNGILTWEQLTEIEQRANEIVYENHPVLVTYPSEEALKAIDYRSKKELSGQVRIVTVADADVCACCGTHVARSGEIGIIKFLSMIHYKGGVRISMLCGKKALLDYEKKVEQTQALSVLFSARPDSITQAAVRMKEENGELSQTLAGAMAQLMELKAERLMPGEEPVLIFEETFTPVQIRKYCELLLEKEKTPLALVCARKAEGEYYYCGGSRSIDMKELGKNLNKSLDGRGGGSSRMVQGTFGREAAAIQKVFGDITAAGLEKGI